MYPNNSKIKIGIIRGGMDNYENSITEGADIISHINKNFSDKYQTLDIFCNREGIIHINGLPVNLDRLAHIVDIVWNTNPSMVNQLDNFSIKHISLTPFSNAVSSNRSMLEEHMKRVGVKMPRHLVIPAYQIDFDGDINKFAFRKAKEVFEKFGSPWIVHTFGMDSNTGIHIAKTFEQLVNAILDIVQSGKSILVEEFITGRVVSLHTVPKFRNQELYVIHNNNLNTVEKENLINIAKNLHTNINANYYLKSSFVINKRGAVYLVNIDLKPNFKEYFNLDMSCQDRGINTVHILEHIIEQALK